MPYAWNRTKLANESPTVDTAHVVLFNLLYGQSFLHS